VHLVAFFGSVDWVVCSVDLQLLRACRVCRCCLAARVCQAVSLLQKQRVSCMRCSGRPSLVGGLQHRPQVAAHHRCSGARIPTWPVLLCQLSQAATGVLDVNFSSCCQCGFYFQSFASPESIFCVNGGLRCEAGCAGATPACCCMHPAQTARLGSVVGCTQVT
jgi:hypothetical protein